MFSLSLFIACTPPTPDPSTIDADGDNATLDVDCDDDDPAVHPSASEQVYDGIDNDCDPSTPDDDLDGDGWRAELDCADRDPDVRPDQTEVAYDGVDNDCNPATLDDDLDQDGFDADEDCADDDASRSPGVPEVYYDGVDNDCDASTVDDDQDGDGVSMHLDCDDTDGSAGAPVDYYLDCDADGYAASIAGGVTTCTPPPPPDTECGPNGVWTQLTPSGSANAASNTTVDCSDSDPLAFPEQTGWYEDPVLDADPDYAYDYDCNGDEESQYGSYWCSMMPTITPNVYTCTRNSGFLQPTPACGEVGSYGSGCLPIGTTGCQSLDQEDRIKRCR